MRFESSGVGDIVPYPEGSWVCDGREGQEGPVGQAEQRGLHQHADRFYARGIVMSCELQQDHSGRRGQGDWRQGN